MVINSLTGTTRELNESELTYISSIANQLREHDVLMFGRKKDNVRDVARSHLRTIQEERQKFEHRK